MGDQDQEVSEQQDNLFYAFAQTVLTRLKALVEPIGGVPVQMRYYAIFGEGSSVPTTIQTKNVSLYLIHTVSTTIPPSGSSAHITIQTKNDYSKLLLSYQFQIFREEEPELLKLFQQPEHTVSPAIFAYGTILAIRWRFLEVIRDVIERHDTLDPTRDQLLESYHRYRDVWTAPYTRYETIIPLLNFSSDVQHEVTLGTYLALSSFTPEEKTQVWNSDVDYYPNVKNPIEFNAFLQSKYKLARTRLQEQNKEYSTEEVNEEAMDVLTALRLTKAGDVGAPAIFESSELRSMLMSTPMITRTHDFVVRQSGNEYNITEAELAQVKNLFASLQHLNSQAQRGGLALALRRFNQAYNRESNEDRIIDLTIALESCLLAGEDKELSYKFALRGAALLSKSRDPKVTKSQLQDLYNARSKIVHGSKILAELKKDSKDAPPGQAAREFLRQSEELVRDILREYVSQMAMPSRIVCKDF